MREDTKLARVRQAMSDGDWDTALKLAAQFDRLGEHGDAIKRAANVLLSPALYAELGYDLEKVKAEGILALKERYSKSWDATRPKSEEADETPK